MAQISNAASADLFRSVSSFHEAPRSTSSYYHQQTMSMGNLPILEYKATEPPPTISKKDKRWAGLYVHSIAMGFVTTALPLTIYPFLTGYLNMEGTQTLSARSLLALPWVLRPLFRALAASLPGSETWRYRRCLLIGWTVANIALTIISFIGVKDPYFPKTEFDPLPKSQLNTTELSLVNQNAPGEGGFYVMLMTVSAIGLVLADVGGDALIEQTANEHFPPLNPGDCSVFTQDMTMKRIGGMLFAFVFIGMTMNGKEYGGSFSFSVGFKKIMMAVGFIASMPTPAAQFFIAERSPERSSFSSCVQPLWSIFQNRGLSIVIACRFVSGVLRGVSATPGSPVALYWANVQPINDSVISFVSTIAAISFIRVAERGGWVPNHVLAILATSVLVLAVDCSITMATIWDVVRSQFLWVGMPLLQAVPSALDFFLLHVVISALTDSSSAELTRELLGVVIVVASSLGAVVTKLVDSSLLVSNDDILQDTYDVRRDASIAFLIGFAAQLLSFAGAYVPPRGSQAIHEWKLRHANASPRFGKVLFCVLFVSFSLSVAVHVLSVNKSTSCLWIAGGRGCV